MTIETPPRPPAEVFAHAKWIWHFIPHWDIVNCYVRARRSFELASVPERALLAISADQSYMLFVNGQLVGRGPARGFHYVWPYDEFDIAPYLQPGKNVIAVRAFQGGRGTFSYIPTGMAGLIVSCEIESLRLDSDTTNWRMVREAGTARGTVPMSMQTSDQEHHDARVDSTRWADVDFDDAHWDLASKVGGSNHGGFGIPPWSGMSPRLIPNFRHTVVSEFKRIGEKSGKSISTSPAVRDVAELMVKEGLTHSLVESQPTEAQRSGHIQTKQAAPDDFQSYLLDLGKLHVGNYTLTIDDAQGGEIIDLFYIEAAEHKDGAVHIPHQPGGNCLAAFATRLIAKPGHNKHTFYHLIGHRYVIVRVRQATSPFLIQLALHEFLYPLEIEGKFDSSDSLLNDIWNTCAWTQQVCMLDAYVDTPHREQAQWWGDARVQAQNTFHLADDAQLLRRGIDCIALQQLPNGLTYGHAPTIAHECILPDFTLTWMLTLWDHYWQTGSTEAFLQHEHRVFAALEYFIEHIDDTHGLVTHDPRYWLFLDWTPIQKDGHPALLSLWLLHAIDKLVILCDLLKKKQLKLSMLQVKAWLLNALEQLVDQDSGLMHDGILPNGSVNPQCSVHTQALAILCGVVPEAHALMLEKSILPELNDTTTSPVRPSAFWITYVFDAAKQLGQGQAVVDCIKRRWQTMIPQGTTWETFNYKPGVESLSHAWSAHPIFHLMQIIGGVRQAAPNWKRVSFTPVDCGIDFKIAIPSPHGLIRVSMDRKQNKTPQLILPPGVEIDG
jgi:alpha-L-rhamnosidase